MPRPARRATTRRSTPARCGTTPSAPRRPWSWTHRQRVARGAGRDGRRVEPVDRVAGGPAGAGRRLERDPHRAGSVHRLRQRPRRRLRVRRPRVSTISCTARRVTSLPPRPSSSLRRSSRRVSIRRALPRSRRPRPSSSLRRSCRRVRSGEHCRDPVGPAEQFPPAFMPPRFDPETIAEIPSAPAEQFPPAFMPPRSIRRASPLIRSRRSDRRSPPAPPVAPEPSDVFAEAADPQVLYPDAQFARGPRTTSVTGSRRMRSRRLRIRRCCIRMRSWHRTRTTSVTGSRRMRSRRLRIRRCCTPERSSPPTPPMRPTRR